MTKERATGSRGMAKEAAPVTVKEDPMITLCRFVVEMKYEDLPSEVTDFAKKHILDTFGVTIGGSTSEGIPEIVEFVKEQGGKEESLIPFYGGKVPASMAAFAIGPMSRALDMGDVNEFGGHSAEYVLPGLLAATGLKDKVAGKEFILAFVLGQEILCRIGGAQRVGRPEGVVLGQGGHYIFGVAAGVGKLLGLNLEEMKNTVGIVRAMTQPHDMAMYFPPTLMVRVHHGFVAQDAINACLLARRGITGPHDVMLGEMGFLRQFVPWETDPQMLTRGLGKEWLMTRSMMKPYSSCKCTHAAISGTVDLIKEHGISVEDIVEIHSDESSGNYNIVSTPHDVRWNPKTMAECQFSMPYTVATAAITGHVFIDSYTDEARTRRDVRELMAKITSAEDPKLPRFAGRVTITLKDGTKYTKEILYVKGQPQKPFAEEDYIEKFKGCARYSAYKLTGPVVDKLIKNILALENVKDVTREIIALVTPP